MTVADAVTEDMQNLDFPAEWEVVTLGGVAEYINGRGFKSTEWGSTGRPILRIQNLTGSGSMLNRYDGPVEDRHIVQSGDLLISWAATLGAYIYRGEEAALNQHIFKVKPWIGKDFLYYGVLNYISKLKAQSQGSGMQHITKGNFENTPFPLPPLAEQTRIVTKIEELFSKLDAGVAELKRTQALLKRYRQSVLHAAVTGELSRAWREAQGGDLEDAGVLLARILDERRAKWAASGKRGQYKEPQGPDIVGLPELPSRWVWGSVEQITSIGIQNGLYVPATQYGNGYSIIRIDDYQDFWSRESKDLRKVDISADTFASYSLSTGDILINRVNSMSHIGKSMYVEERNLPSVFESNIMRFSVSSNCNARYVKFYLASQIGRSRIIKNARLFLGFRELSTRAGRAWG